MNAIRLTVLLAALALVTGCASPHAAVFERTDQLQQRAYQSRAFDTTDRERTLRAVIATMQDLGFVIEKVDARLGTVSGTRLALYEVKMTVTAHPHGAKQLMVRANAQFRMNANDGLKPIEEAKPYQDFFAALAKSLFLAGQEVG